jgi:hypothetical protein
MFKILISKTTLRTLIKKELRALFHLFKDEDGNKELRIKIANHIFEEFPDLVNVQ